MNNITELFELGDPTIEVTATVTNNETMEEHVYIQKKEPMMFCPTCRRRMLSKGIRIRELNHPILQNGYRLFLDVTVHKWLCKDCRVYDHDHFTFFEDNKHNTSIVPLMILGYMKDLGLTARQVARFLNVSDTYVHNTFMQYVNLPRLPLPDVISIDEVYMHFDSFNLYAMIIMDFSTNQIIDILINRHEETTADYFLNIPLEERKNVKYIISDMYKPYLRFTDKYFPNAVSIIDSFHIISLIETHIIRYINQVKRRYQDQDEIALQEKNYQNNNSYKSMKKSREVYMLEKYKWFLLKKHDDISYEPYWRNRKGIDGYWFNPVDMEKSFMELDKNFLKIRELKELYIHFNEQHVNDPEGALEDLEKIIQIYRESDIAFFRNIAVTLETYKLAIANSFIYIIDEIHQAKEDLLRRLSNGPMEGFNRQPKDLKRQSRGVSNFEYTRNRILWSNRVEPPMRAVPLSIKEVHTVEGRKRGPYNK